jgi:hypothetical protein
MGNTRSILADLVKRLGEVLGALDPETVPLVEVRSLWDGFVSVERLGSAGKVLLAARLAETRLWSGEGFRSAAEWMAAGSGSSVGRSRAELGASGRLKELSSTADALRRGELSFEQADAVSGAAAVNPEAEQDLLEESKRESLKGLRDEAARRRAEADCDAEERNRRLRRERRCRGYVDAEGAWNLSARGPAGSASGFVAELDPECDRVFREARARGERESRDAYMFDALMRVAARSGQFGDGAVSSPTPVAPASSGDDRGGVRGGGGVGVAAGETPVDVEDPEVAEPGAGSLASPLERPRRIDPSHLALIRVDLGALVHGSPGDGEVCEIAGLGPVPVSEVRRLLGDSILKLVITRGVDVVSVAHLGRGPSAAQKVALLWAGSRCCVLGCNRTRVEFDHRVPWATVRETRLSNIDPFCEYHHDLKTYKGWALVAGEGRRRMVPPGDPDHPAHTERDRKRQSGAGKPKGTDPGNAQRDGRGRGRRESGREPVSAAAHNGSRSGGTSTVGSGRPRKSREGPPTRSLFDPDEVAGLPARPLDRKD